MNYPFLSEEKLVGFLPIATWVDTSQSMKSPDEKIGIFIICTDSAVGRLLDSHYSVTENRRWTRLRENNLWIFPDLLHIFNGWGQIWNTTKRNLAEYQYQIHDSAGTTPLLDLARAVHDEVAKTLSAQEQLRVHKSSIKRFLRFTEAMAAQTLTEMTHDRLEDIDFHEETSQVILRQLENMTSLVWEYILSTMAGAKIAN